MSIVYPAQNTLWFWFDQATRRALHGVVEDALRKLDVFCAKGFPLEGFEIFVVPQRLPEGPGHAAEGLLARRLRQLPRVSAHIGDSDHEFLARPQSAGHLARLRRLLDSLETDAVVVHAHHFRAAPEQSAETLLAALPGADIRIENNGFDSPWGSRPENLEALLERHPEFGFCLDIAHVKDFADLSLDQFIASPTLMSRMREVHLSYSTLQLPEDPYPARGFPGYGPYHALFAALGEEPSERTVRLIAGTPVVVEGIVPREDRNLDLLRREVGLARGEGRAPAPAATAETIP